MKVKPPQSDHPIRFGPGLVTGAIDVDDATGEQLKADGWTEVDPPKPKQSRKKTKPSTEEGR